MVQNINKGGDNMSEPKKHAGLEEQGHLLPLHYLAVLLLRVMF